MAKARMLSQEVAEDSKVALCSDEAALTYAFTLPFLDRDGLCSGKPSWIAGRALQERQHLQHKAGMYIGEWVAQGLVIRYQGSDGPVLFFPGFRKHNANMPYEKEQRSKFPPPPGYHRDEDENGVCHGLIPDDPDVAGRLAETFDARSLYYKALTEATHHKETLEQSLGLEEKPKTTEHNEVPTWSGLGRDLVGMNRIEVEQQTEVEVEVEENNNMRALDALIQAEAEKAVVVVGAPALTLSLDDDQKMALLSWLWLYNGWNQEDLRYRDIFRRCYESDPFRGMKQPAAVMVSNAKARAPAPLCGDDRAEMMDALRALQKAQP